MDVIAFLAQLGVGLAANSIYDLIISVGEKGIAQEDLTSEIQNKINLHGVKMNAETVINALVESGFVSIQQTHLHANESLLFGSVVGGASVGYDSKLTTATTAIEASGNASINTVGNAYISQNADGSISFHVGENGNVSFKN